MGKAYDEIDDELSMVEPRKKGTSYQRRQVDEEKDYKRYMNRPKHSNKLHHDDSARAKASAEIHRYMSGYDQDDEC